MKQRRASVASIKLTSREPFVVELTVSLTFICFARRILSWHLALRARCSDLVQDRSWILLLIGSLLMGAFVTTPGSSTRVFYPTLVGIGLGMGLVSNIAPSVFQHATKNKHPAIGAATMMTILQVRSERASCSNTRRGNRTVLSNCTLCDRQASRRLRSALFVQKSQRAVIILLANSCVRSVLPSVRCSEATSFLRRVSRRCA